MVALLEVCDVPRYDRHASWILSRIRDEIKKNTNVYFAPLYPQALLLERFSYDLEMKTREQNRNNKRTEIERFDWFIERTDKRAWLLIG